MAFTQLVKELFYSLFFLGKKKTLKAIASPTWTVLCQVPSLLKVPAAAGRSHQESGSE